MSRVIIGKWGKHLAVRIPLNIAKDAHLSKGEFVDISTFQGDIVIRRPAFQSNAKTVVKEIISERKKYKLDHRMIQSLLQDGRRG